MYPWPSFGGFLFGRNEHPVWETDAGWKLQPTINRQRSLGAGNDLITTLAIGSAERTFECYLSPSRFDALQNLLNTRATFTDWTRPIPDSRLATLVEVSPLSDAVATYVNEPIPGSTNGIALTYSTQRRRRTKITLVSS